MFQSVHFYSLMCAYMQIIVIMILEQFPKLCSLQTLDLICYAITNHVITNPTVISTILQTSCNTPSPSIVVLLVGMHQ